LHLLNQLHSLQSPHFLQNYTQVFQSSISSSFLPCSRPITKLYHFPHTHTVSAPFLVVALLCSFFSAHVIRCMLSFSVKVRSNFAFTTQPDK
jgi:hypothetical protein